MKNPQEKGEKTGFTTVALFAMHGAIYLVLKTDGEVQAKVRGWVNNTIILFVICYATTTMATLLYLPHMGEPFKSNPWTFALPVATMLANRLGIVRIVSTDAVREVMRFLQASAQPATVIFACFGSQSAELYRRVVSTHSPDC